MCEFITAVFIIISFIGWIINQVNAQNKRPAPRRPPRRPGDRRVQAEIDEFLREAKGGRRQGRPVVATDDIEIVEDEPPRRPAPRRPAPQRSTRRPPGSGVKGRHLSGQQDLGRSVQDHLRTYMQDHVADDAREHMAHSVDQSVTQHLGSFSADAGTSLGSRAAAETRGRRRSPAAALMAALRTPAGVRNAVLMQEIFTRPRRFHSR